VLPVLGLSDRDVERLMREALREADAAGRAGELPIGAVVAIAGDVVGRGRNRQRERRTQLAHAEVAALLAGGDAVYLRHDEAVLVTTVEPCPFCLGAAVMADVPHIVFAAADPRAGVPEVIEASPYIRRHIRRYVGGVLAADSLALIGRHDPELRLQLGS
jgi:tRNA(adenine34) deaminase